MIRKIIFIIALLGLLVALRPPSFSPRAVTGEEALGGQLLGVLHWVNSAIRPQPELAADADIAYTDVGMHGMNVFLELEPSLEVREEAFRLLSEAGFSFVRQQFPWEGIEISAKDDFWDHKYDHSAWDKYDHLVNLSEQYGVELIVRLDNPPEWSRSMGNGVDGRDTMRPPDNFDDYADFVAAVVGRYAGRVTYFQLWNEPNIYPEWGDQPPNPEAFTQMACQAYERAKATNPDAVILAAALAPTVDMLNNNMNDLVFLQRAYQAGYGDCFDIFSAQGYGFWSGPSDHRLRPTVINYPHNLLLRDVMVQNGDAEKPIWISEVGWNTPEAGIPEIFGNVTDAEQALYARELYERAAREWPWVGVINYWYLKRPAPEPEQPSYYFRVMEPDFTPKPVWNTLVESAKAEPPLPEPVSGQSYRPPLFALSAGTLFFGLTYGWLRQGMGENKRR